MRKYKIGTSKKECGHSLDLLHEVTSYDDKTRCYSGKTLELEHHMPAWFSITWEIHEDAIEGTRFENRFEKEEIDEKV